MVKEAVDCDHYKWLNWVWAFRKNYTFIKDKNKKIFKLEDLFELITT
jgi:hypothetical protein